MWHLSIPASAWATVLRRPGVLTNGPDLSPLVRQAPDRGRLRGQPRPDPRDRGRSYRFLPPGHDPEVPGRAIFGVITNGTGLMSRYRWLIPPADRWAIIACLRELRAQAAGKRRGPASGHQMRETP